ncbi:MAG: hypothetical protein ACE5OZ_05710 [Candidatus Heimdallarchaeota archaeon]
MNKQNSLKVDLRALLEGKDAENFRIVKSFYGVSSNAEVVRLLLTEKIRQIESK